ncbi:MAG: LexA family transcriptional regulator [Clostridia bacterium]|nr:LexA family transcriptional regulator [Clostridia bacterium]
MARRKFDTLQDDHSAILPIELRNAGVYHHKLYFATRIKELRQAAHMTQAELSSALGISLSAVKGWEAGRSRPDIANIPMLCRALNVRVSEFYAPDDQEENRDREEQELIASYRAMSDPHRHILVGLAHDFETMDRALVRTIAPVYRLRGLPYADDSLAAGVGTAGFEANCTLRYVHDVPSLRDADILFRVNGDSMEPDYPNGCTVMVKKEPNLAFGEVGVFDVDGVLYIKVVQEDGLHSLNPAYQPMLAERYGEIRCIGRVLGIMDEQDFASEEEVAEFKAQK